MSINFGGPRHSFMYQAGNDYMYGYKEVSSQNFYKMCNAYLNTAANVQTAKICIKENITLRPDIHSRQSGDALHSFLKKNNQSLSALVIFLESFASSILSRSMKIPCKPSRVFLAICNELKGVDKLQVGNFSLHNGKLKLRNTPDPFKGCKWTVTDLLTYACEVEMIIDGKLAEEDSLRKVMQLEGQAKENSLLKFLGFKKDTKKEVHSPNAAEVLRQNSQELMERMQRPPPNLNHLPKITDKASIEKLREKDLFVIQYMRGNPFLIRKYANKPATLDFKPPEYKRDVSVLDVLRAKFRNEPLDEKLARAALAKTEGCPEAAAQWIRQQRRKVEPALARFPGVSEARKREMADQCLFDERFIYLLASEAVLDAVPKPEKMQTTEEMLRDEAVNREKRVTVAAMEYFAGNFDRLNRANALLDLLSYSDQKKRPAGEGWWDSYELFTFQEFVSAVQNLQDYTPAELRACSILNNQCGVCEDYFHRDNIFDLECRCIFCNGCVMGFLKEKCGGNIESALECLTPSCPNASEVAAMDDETKNNAFFIKYQTLEALGKKRPEFASVVNQYMELFRKYMTKRMPQFTACAHCESGQIQGDLDNNKMTCIACNGHTCHSCKYQWFDEHKELTCAKYKIWLSKNHPEILGLTEAALAGSFIECPNCHETYLLQRGGCLHFECRRCPGEFCGFCYETFFTKKNPCKSCEQAKQTMLHAHHPRNCYYYLRDESCEWLVELLESQDVDWKRELADHKADEGRCTVKLTSDEGVESQCGKEVYAGFELCEKHLKEFLSLIIFEKRVDPIFKYDLNMIKTLVRRENLEMPDEKLPIEELQKRIKETCPLMNEEEEA